ncbi:MAG: AIR synthase-related protein [bacterium]|nr:AIR synthase-related protein [bacterium]
MGIHEIRVGTEGESPEGRAVREEAERLGIEGIEAVGTSRIFRFEGISDEEAILLAERLLSDPITEDCALDQYRDPEDRRVVEVAMQPGAMNPEVASLLKAAADLGVKPTAADSSTEYHFQGDVSAAAVERLVRRELVNETVQRANPPRPETLRITGETGPVRSVPVREKSPRELEELSKEMALQLDGDEMRVIQEYFRKEGREPTDCELEIIAGRESEHCGHKTFKARMIVEDPESGARTEVPSLMDRIRTTSERFYGDKVVSAFVDNAGVYALDDRWAVLGKVETHNSPSGIEPFGGASTGTGGVLRDIVGTGQGAEVISSTDMFCFQPNDTPAEAVPEGVLPPDYIARNVYRGVEYYGNRMGIPTNNGSEHRHPDFVKPTVIVGAYGLIPIERAEKGEPLSGDRVVAVGGRTGRDGLHGATMSSVDMTERTATVDAQAVQIGNPIEEKRFADAILEARDEGLIRAITDCGAAGFSSAIGEMAEETGATVHLERAPLKYEGLSPWEIFLSESQERMVLAVAPEHLERFREICAKYRTEATDLGEFDGSNRLTVLHGETMVADLDYEFLNEGFGRRTIEARWETPRIEERQPPMPETEEAWVDVLTSVLAHDNVCSKEPVVRQYDHGVQGRTIVEPYGGVQLDAPNDAAVMRPFPDKEYGIVQAHGLNPVLNRLDPYEGAKWAVAEAMANYVSAGGDPDDCALIDNFISPSPDRESLGSLHLQVEGLTDALTALKRPAISGKDSLSSTYRGRLAGEEVVIKIPPVLCMSVFGKIPDVERAMTTDFKRHDSVLYMVGEPTGGLGGSIMHDVRSGRSGDVPKTDLEKLPHVLRAVHRGIKTGEVLSCHDISEGGLAVAVSEMAFGGDNGALLDFDPETDLLNTLFNETAGRFVVELPRTADPRAVFGAQGARYVRPIGHTVPYRWLHVRRGGRHEFSAETRELKAAWKRPLAEALG